MDNQKCTHPIVRYFSYSTMALLLLNSCGRFKEGSERHKITQNVTPNACDEDPKKYPVLGMLFAPELQPTAKVRLVQGDDSIDLSAEAPDEFIRRKEPDGKVTLWQSLYVMGGRLQKEEDFKLTIETNDQVIQKNGRSSSAGLGRCQIHPQNAGTVEVTGPNQAKLAGTKDQYLLNGGVVFEVDPKTNTGKFVDKYDTYTEIEVVRLVTSAIPCVCCSQGTFDEKEVVGKVKLGMFTELGIDRGPLPQDTLDSGRRVIYGKK